MKDDFSVLPNRRIEAIERELIRQAKAITELREQIARMNQAPAMRWWEELARDSVKQMAEKAAGK